MSEARTISIPWPHPDDHPLGIAIVVPVLVNWFEVPEEHIVAKRRRLGER